MRILNGYFNWVAPPRIGEVVHPVFGAVSRKDLTEAQALKLWQAGFPHLAITPEGRAALLQEKVPAKAGTPRPAPAPPPEPAEEEKGTPASAGASEEADERPRKGRRRGTDTPEGERPAE